MLRLNQLFVFIPALEPSLPWKCGIKQEEVTLAPVNDQHKYICLLVNNELWVMQKRANRTNSTFGFCRHAGKR